MLRNISARYFALIIFIGVCCLSRLECAIEDIMGTELRIHIVTWNVADDGPPEKLQVEPLLNFSEERAVEPDIIVIGFQEIASTGDWSEVLSKALTQKDYVQIQSRQLLGMMIYLYTKIVHLPYIRHVETTYTKCGFKNLFGSKGAVSIRADIYGCNVIFVNSHLAAFDEKFSQRVAQFDRILETQQFSDKDSETILDHDYVFWLGDLNFRLDNVTREEVLKLVQQKEYGTLLAQDQLNYGRKEELIFLEFEEGAIDFPPTYKFDPNTDIYDTSEKQRKPAWCDRVLWLVQKDAFAQVIASLHDKKIDTDLYVKLNYYNSLPQYKNSDHKPVVAGFTCRVFPIRASVGFEMKPSASWRARTENIAQYTRYDRQVTSKWDWIGLYKVGFQTVNDWQSWVRPKITEQNTTSVVFSKSKSRVSPGEYRLLYLNERKEVLGMSEPFRVESRSFGLVEHAGREALTSDSSADSSESSDQSSGPSSQSSSDEEEETFVPAPSPSTLQHTLASEDSTDSKKKYHHHHHHHHHKKQEEPGNPELKENQAPEELQTTIVREDMNLDELKGIIPQLYSFRNRYSDPSVIARRASTLSARIATEQAKQATTPTTGGPRHTDL